MLISSENLFSGASMSRGKGTVRKIASKLNNEGDLPSFDSLLQKKTVDEEVSIGTSLKGEPEGSAKDLLCLFAKVDGGVETGIRLSLPDFMKNGSECDGSVPQAFVSAETVDGGPSMGEGSSVDSASAGSDTSVKGGNSFAFALLSEPEDKDREQMAEDVLGLIPLSKVDISSEKKYEQIDGKDAEAGSALFQNSSEESNTSSDGIAYTDYSEFFNAGAVVTDDESSTLDPGSVKIVDVNSHAPSRPEIPFKEVSLPADEQASFISDYDGVNGKSLTYEKGSLSDELFRRTPESESQALIDDPELLNMQALINTVSDADKTKKADYADVKSKTEVAVAELSQEVRMQNHLRDGVPLVESPSFSEMTEKNPSKSKTDEALSGSRSQIVANFEQKLSFVDSFDEQRSVSKNKVPESERENLAGFQAKDIDNSLSEEIKEPSLHESLSFMPDSGVSSRTQKVKGSLQTIPLQKGPTALSDGVTNVVKFINSRGETRAQVIVDPPAIGKVRIEIHATPGGMEANLRVDNIVVRDMIKNQLPLLQDMLAQQGISLSEMNVDVHSGDGSRKQWVEKNDNRRRTGDENEDMEPEFTARIDLEKGLLVWTA